MELAYYGDDFTGSTDVLEALALAGIAAELFVTEPVRSAVPPQAIGLAGLSRTFSPAEMEAHLPAAFTSLAAGRPRFLHYKVCSTFDSSPAVGSIGRAIEIGRRTLPRDGRRSWSRPRISAAGAPSAISSRSRGSTARPTGSIAIRR